MPKFTVSGTIKKEQVLRITADTPQEAVEIYRKKQPNYRVDGVETDTEFWPLIGYCEYSGKPILEGDEYESDGEVMWLKTSIDDSLKPV